MPGEGPFLWLGKDGPPSGWWQLPPNGMCVSVFLFVTRAGRVLVGKYADDARWTALTGLDPDRYRTHGKGWTLPASHLKFGEDPQAAARRVAEDVLGLRGVVPRLSGVGSDQYTPRRFPHLGQHYDLWYFYEVALAPDARPATPPWYRELSFEDPGALPAQAWARGHEDVVARWLTERAGSPPSGAPVRPG